jgi:N-acetylglutamate synthase-like GNAT family acetyltransferase
MRIAPATSPLRVYRSRRAASPPTRSRTRVSATRQLVIRAATAADTSAIHKLIDTHVADGRLLPRRRDEIAAHASRFLVAVQGRRVVACADLAPLSRHVVEVRSLVVSDEVRSRGIGRRLVDELASRAAASGFETLCAFTHVAGYFVRMGFSIVPHTWLPEKIEADCRSCALFRTCGQYAVMLPLVRAHQTCVPLTSLHA